MSATTLPTSDRAKALRRRFLVVATILAIADGFDLSLFGVTLPVILAKGEFGVRPETAGAVAGILADRIGKKMVMPRVRDSCHTHPASTISAAADVGRVAGEVQPHVAPRRTAAPGGHR
ncbi:hypothetical protein [Streptomyces torulosus]|uniref:hypothetical protein n=1 Tax=Streptomyces torulosus TaxID=68276 RepID=UPI0006EBC6C9|nr:hypothetical protein [Streptomyces torulosus]